MEPSQTTSPSQPVPVPVEKPQQQPAPLPQGSPKPPTPRMGAPKKNFTLPRIGWRRGVVGVCVLALVAIGTFSYISRDSLPGEQLFTMKVNVLERGIAMTKFTKSSQASYAVARMEKRLNELLVLKRDTATSSEETLHTIAALSQSHAEGAVEALSDSALTPEGRINSLARITTVAKAQETLAQEFPEFSPVTAAYEALRKSLADALKNGVEAYASTTPEAQVKIFIAQHVSNVSDALPSVAPGSAAQRISIRRVEEANESIEENKLAPALLALLKAEEAIAVDEYVWGSERGEENIVVPPPVTEGQ